MKSVTIAAAAVALVLALPAAAQDNTKQPSEVIALDRWKYDDLYKGWSARDLMEAAVRDESGAEVADIHNLMISPAGKLVSIVMEAGGILDIKDAHFAMPWESVELSLDMGRVAAPVSEETIREFSLFKDDGQSARNWRATELLDAPVRLQDGRPYGLIQDLIFDEKGQVSAVVVEPDVTEEYRGPYALPWYADAYDPAQGVYELPYSRQQIASLQAFETERRSVLPPQ